MREYLKAQTFSCPDEMVFGFSCGHDNLYIDFTLVDGKWTVYISVTARYKDTRWPGVIFSENNSVACLTQEQFFKYWREYLEYWDWEPVDLSEAV